MPRKQPSGPSAQTQLRVGRLTKAHGLKGGLKLELFTDDPSRRFTPGAEFSLQVPEESPWHGRKLTLVELRWYNSMPVGFFADVADRTAAESLVKAILWIDQTPDEPAEDDAWYDHQLVGLDVVRDDRKIGVIDRLEHMPAQDLLVVRVGTAEVMVPFVRAIVPTVDVAAGRVVVTPPLGLFEEIPDDEAESGEPESGEPHAGEPESDDAAPDASSTAEEQAAAPRGEAPATTRSDD
ncbi:MAG: ribosome maturation factor RimM [Naasia sp.]